MTVDQSNVLNVHAAREAKDERHLCPLQLDVIQRAVVLWSNLADTVLSPFMGIGSEGVMSMKLGRKFFGIELKESYWRQSCRYLDAEDSQRNLFEVA
jgi:DNA modification methylase